LSTQATTSRFPGAWLPAFLYGFLLFLFAAAAHAQSPTVPAADATCVVSALNRNATMNGSYYMIPGVPSQLGTYRIRAACSDGTVGQTALITPSNGNAFTAGPIVWGNVDPIPQSLAIEGPSNISYGQSVQLTTSARLADGSTRDVSAGATGTNYVSSMPSLASISKDGLLTVWWPPLSQQGYGREIIISATNDGTAVAKRITIGPRGTIAGKVTLADGTTPVAGAQVSLQLLAPLTNYPMRTTEADGSFRLPDAPAGDYTITVLDPKTGMRGRRQATLSAGSAQGSFDVALSGQGDIRIVVTSGANQPVANAQVVVVHSQFQGEFRSLTTGADGVASATQFTAGEFTVSVRDPASSAIGTGSGSLAAGVLVTLPVSLQAVGIIRGKVLGADGVAAQAGVQVRLLSQTKGIVSQALSGQDGSFRFDSLSLADGPYSLQALRDGVIQSSKGNLVLASAGQELVQDLQFGVLSSGATVNGRIINENSVPQAGAAVRLVAANGQQYTATSDAGGNYLLDGIPQGAFTISAEVNGLSASATGTVATDGQQITLNLVLRAQADLKVKLMLSTGQAAAAATIELHDGRGQVRQLAGDQNGDFSFAGLPLGSYAITAVHAASGERGAVSGFLDTAGEVREIQLQLTAVGKLRVQVLAGGAPVAEARVFLALQGPLVYGAQTVTDAAGFAEFAAVPHGPYNVTAIRTTGAVRQFARTRGMLTTDNVATSVALSNNSRFFTISGKVFDTKGQPVPNQWVRLSTRDMPVGGTVPIPNPLWDEYVVRSDASGAYSFENVALNDDGRGRLKLDAFVGNNLRGRLLPNTPADKAVVDQNIVLFGAGTAHGKTAYTSGAPMQTAKVSAVHADDALFVPSDFQTVVDQAGRYALMLPVGASRLTATTIDGKIPSSLDRAIPADGTDVVADFMFPEGAKIKINVTNSVPGSATRVKVNGVEIGTVAGSGHVVHAAYEGNYNITAVTDYGDSRDLSVTVTAADDGKTIDLYAVFDDSASRYGKLRYGWEAHIYSLALKQGDKLNLRIVGAQVDDLAPSSVVWLGLRKPNAQEGSIYMATGIGTGPADDYVQSKELSNITINETGMHSLQIRTYFSNGGGYRLSADANGQPVTILPFQGGGTVQGTVYNADGSPAPGLTIAMHTLSNVGTYDAVLQNTATTSDANGRYRFEGIPVDDYQVTVLQGQDEYLLYAYGKVDAPGQVVTTDLRFPKRTTLQVSATIGDGLDLPSQMYFRVTDNNGTRLEGPLNFSGSRTSSTFETLVVGDVITLEATHPYNNSIKTTRTINANNGTLPVNLLLRSASVSGRVLFGDGLPVENTWVAAYKSANMEWSGYLDSTYTDETGSYDLAGLPMGMPIFVAAQHPDNYLYTIIEVPPLGDENQTGRNIVFGPTGAIAGTVRYSNNTAAIGAVVELSGEINGNSFNMSANASDDGTFSVHGVPAGVPVQVKVATPGAFGESETRSVTIAAMNDVVTLPAFTFTAGPTLRISVADPMVLRPSVGECGSNFYRLITSAGPVDVNAEWGGENNQNQATTVVRNVPQGPMQVELRDGCSRWNEEARPLGVANITISGDQVHQVFVPVSVVRVRVSHANQMPAMYVGGNLQWTDANGETHTLWEPLREQDTPFVTSMYFIGVPVGDFTVTASDYYYGGGNETSKTYRLDAIGPLTVDLTLTSAITVLQVVVKDVEGLPHRDADGQACQIRYNYGFGELMYLDYCGRNGGVMAASVSPGQMTAYAIDDHSGVTLASASGTIADQSVGVFNLVLNKIKGTVRLNNGSPVPNTTVMLYQQGHTYYTYSDDNGAYAFTGIPPGPIELDAEHGVLGKATPVQTDAVAQSVTTSDLTLVASGLVTGVVRDANNQLLAYGEVVLTSTGNPGIEHWSSTDHQGRYYFQNVAVGDLTVVARPEGGKAYAIGTGKMVSDQQVVTVDLASPATAAVTVRVTGPGGPVANALVTYQTVTNFGPFGPYHAESQTNAAGIAQFAAVQPGAFIVSAVTTGAQAGAGQISGSVDPQGAAEVEVVMGNAIAFPFSLGAFGIFDHAVVCDGGVEKTAANDYRYLNALTVGGGGSPCFASGLLTPGITEMTLGPADMGAVRVNRKLFLSAQGGFVRVLDTYSNLGLTEASVAVDVGHHYETNGDGGLHADPAANDQRYAVLAYPPAAHVFGGVGGAANPPNTFRFQQETGNNDGSQIYYKDLGYRWTLSISPGQSVSLLHYYTQGGDADSAQARAQLLSDNAAPSMFDGISASEKQSIRNFSVP
jgi:hypothetical protein